jgi:hypothetical protein
LADYINDLSKNDFGEVHSCRNCRSWFLCGS